MKIITKIKTLHDPPKVLVASPIVDMYRYCLPQYIESLKTLTYKNYDILLVDNSESDEYKKEIESFGVKVLKSPHLFNVHDRLPAARNVIRQYALDHDYDFFLCLEHDIIPPRDVIQRLLRHKKLAVSGVYYKTFVIAYRDGEKITKRAQEVRPVLYGFPPSGSKDQEAMTFCTMQDVEGDKIMRIRGSGFGCLLIHRFILEKFPFHTNEQKNIFDDVALSHDLFYADIPMYVDTSVKCQHLETGKYDDDKYDRTFQRGKYALRSS